MDNSHAVQRTKSLADLAPCVNTLAAHNLRLSSFLDELPRRADLLLAAAAGEDWKELRRLSEDLAKPGAGSGREEISVAARSLISALDQSFDTLILERHLRRLLRECEGG